MMRRRILGEIFNWCGPRRAASEMAFASIRNLLVYAAVLARGIRVIDYSGKTITGCL
jgi:hypothetical protein